VTSTLLDLLAEPNIVKDNALITKFGIDPKPFTPENLSYMRQFKRTATLGKFFGRTVEEEQTRGEAMKSAR
ncbi:MAG: hypothetical protein IT323_03525, partial [Anaerolineae bacterium]|nr:hypothetical protein [Anaerolineae bacterium]